MSASPYTRDILRLAAHVPGRVGFDQVDGPELRSPTCGARIKLAVVLDDAELVMGIAPAIEACAFGQAATAVMAGGAAGKTRADADAMVDAVRAWLGGGERPDWSGIETLEPVLPLPGRHGAVLLPFRALSAAIEAAR